MLLDLPIIGSPIAPDQLKEPDMLKLKVPDVSCSHCAATIEKAVRSVDPAAEVDVELTTKVAIIATIAPVDRVRSAIRSAGYENQPIED